MKRPLLHTKGLLRHWVADKSQKRLLIAYQDRIFSRLSTCQALALPEENFDFFPSPQLPPQSPTFSCKAPEFAYQWEPLDGGRSCECTREELRAKMQECAKDGNLMESLRFLRLTEPSVLEYNSLLYCYLRSGRVDMAGLFKVFEEMRNFGPSPNAWTVNILFNGLCRLGYLEDALSLLNEMCGCCGFIPSFSALKGLLRKSLCARNAEISLQAVGLMFRFQYLPTLTALNSLILSLTRAGRLTDAYQLLKSLFQKGVVPNVYTYNPLLFGLCNSDQSYCALSLFYNLKKKGLKLNSYSYTALILGFSQEGHWSDAFRVLDQMETDGYMPSVVTYTILLQSLCKDGKIEEAFSMLNTMHERGCQPDLTTWNVLLYATCCHGTLPQILKFIQAMEEKGYLRGCYAYCIGAHSLLKYGLVDRSIDLLQKVQLQHEDSSVDTVTWNVHFHTLCLNKRTREILSMVNSMVDNGFQPSAVTYNIILKGLCNEGNLDEALQFLDCDAWKDSGPDVVSFNTILSAACKLQDTSMIQRVIRRMGMEGIELNIVGITCLMGYYAKAGKLLECVNLFEYMIHHGYTPNTITYNVLLDSLCKKGLLYDAYWIYNDFKNFGTTPDVISYNILINASIRKSDYLLMNSLLRDMYNLNLAPDAVTIGSLAYGLCKAGKIKAAFYLENFMLAHEIKPSISYFNTLLSNAFQTESLWDVFLILLKMKIERIEPDYISLKFFSLKMAKGGKRQFPNAMKVLQILMSREGISHGVEVQ